MKDSALPIQAAFDDVRSAPEAGHSLHDELEGVSEQRATVRSIFWRVVAFALNLGLFMILFQFYKVARRTFIQRGESVGFAHAVQVIDFEKRLHLFIEPDLQSWIIARPDWVIRGLNYYYFSFMPLFYACCAAALLFGPVTFRFWRRVFFCSMLIALPWYAIYPLAPPRFINAAHGYPQYSLIDTLARWGPNYFSDDGMVTANHFAAMPSMHIGWSTIGALMLATCLPRVRGINVGAIIGVLHVSIMTLTVIATGNHYWLDAVGGWIVIAAAFGGAIFLTDRLPIRLPRWFSPT